jgi:hypothetical protein
MICDEPYEYSAVNADQEICYTTHAMSPANLLQVFESTYHLPAPESYLLTIRGYEFNLGAPLSDRARNNMQHAIDFLLESVQPHKSVAGA